MEYGPIIIYVGQGKSQVALELDRECEQCEGKGCIYCNNIGFNLLYVGGLIAQFIERHHLGEK